MKKLDNFLKFKKKKIQKRNIEVDEKTIFHLFMHVIKEEFGNQGQKNITPTFLKNSVIFVKIQNSIWAQELWIQRNFFIDNLNNKIGGEVIKDIKISN
ncbi:MAG: DUF721 domain-containing protein [Candidatus Moranbacteria bacterium]|nr:DUF721 domain-containing protein [Candidatus Moranbacteria bacterium]